MEEPKKIFFDGEIIPWENATVHVWSETAIRATNVFEGLRAYWINEKRQWNVIAVEQHLNRMMQSARLLRIPHNYTKLYIWEGIEKLLQALSYETQVYIRPTIFIRKGSYGYKPEKTNVGIYIAGLPVPSPIDNVPIHKYIVTAWQKSSDLTLPPRIKTGANYGNFRLPRIEADIRGYDDAILLNERGKVSETGGATIFIIRNNVLITPPISAGILESITRDVIIQIARNDFSLKVEEREIDRTELYIADEVFSCGTMQGINAVVQVDDYSINNSKPGVITSKLFKQYIDIVYGKEVDKYNIVTAVQIR